ncbi:HAMP domain-containing histidine kinase [Novosphingobium flavum]|uniref:histidine kinase n=1 Tax=Novosphingobium flavum TaxID=1778672 RepID=A0A7X1FSY0_9SPHN|nr:HAMP domain-containing sensor histidine kinase [Novosphingobium flavum]MBC2666394.1 HAMP domain-containing histidine kinase [Novosphingobium flavum]
MTGTVSQPGASARTDGNDRLIAADEPLLGLHLQCGGEMPGTLAIPALFEAVRKARALGLKLARPIIAHGAAETITAWVEIEPLGETADGGAGALISLRGWQTRPLPAEDEQAASRRRIAVEREIAEFSARLDAAQQVLFAEALPGELTALSEAMAVGVGRPWTDFLTIEGSSHRQPLHWRLLDGAPVRVPGSDRPWRATLVPQFRGGIEPAGFELYLASDVPFEPASPAADTAPATGMKARVIGREVAPVLRQPIARIIANAETIRARLAGPLDDEYSAYASDIAAAGQHLLALIDDLTDLEVVEAEDFSTAPDRIDLAEVARQAAGILGVKAREAEISIDPPRMGESLMAVAEFRRVLQVLLNLVGNALRYAPGQSQVWIRLEQEGHLARVIVADQGPGLDPEQQRKVFEKFERLGRSGDGGSGLGLYISRKLARAMGGELSVESAPGQGARFILSVPAVGSGAAA